MKHKILIFVVIFMLGLPIAAMAAVFSGTDDYSLPKEETVSDDLYAGGGNIVVSGKVNGDMIAGGGNIKVIGNVAGDLIAAGGNIDVFGEVGDDARIAGGNLTFSGKITDDLIVGGGSVLILDGAEVGGDMVTAGGRVVMEGTVLGKANLNGGEVKINGKINGDVRVRADEITIGPKAEILGNFVYDSPNEAKISESAQITGEITYNPVKKVGKKTNLGGVIAGLGLIKILAMLVGSLIGVWLFPQMLHRISERAISSPGKEFLRGLILVIVMPIVGIILLITILGSWIGGIIMLLYILGLCLAGVFSGVVFGAWLWKMLSSEKQARVSWITAIVGVLVLSVLAMIPVIGWIMMMIVFLIVYGSVVYLFYQGVWEKNK